MKLALLYSIPPITFSPAGVALARISTDLCLILVLRGWIAKGGKLDSFSSSELESSAKWLRFCGKGYGLPPLNIRLFICSNVRECLITSPISSFFFFLNLGCCSYSSEKALSLSILEKVSSLYISLTSPSPCESEVPSLSGVLVGPFFFFKLTALPKLTSLLRPEV